MATNEWALADSDEVEKLATPLMRLAVPNVVAPSLNVTVPVADEGLTEAVSVTLPPKRGAVEDTVRVTAVVEAVATDTETPELVLLE